MKPNLAVMAVVYRPSIIIH